MYGRIYTFVDELEEEVIDDINATLQEQFGLNYHQAEIAIKRLEKDGLLDTIDEDVVTGDTE